MIDLRKYREYWEGVAATVPEITGVLPVTVDDQMGKKIQSLPAESVTLFVFPPLAKSQASNPDAYKERNDCIIFVMAKYDPQRCTSFSVLERMQPLAAKIKEILLSDQRAGCSTMRIDVGSIDTTPETELYGRFAGWSIGFNVIS